MKHAKHLYALLALVASAPAWAIQAPAAQAPAAKAEVKQATTLGVGDAAPALSVAKWVKGQPIEKLEKGNAVELLLGALENCRPKLEVKSRRVGGATYQVPVEITLERQNSMALRWLAAAAQGRKGTTMDAALAAELVDAYNNTGNVVKKREETHKMAQANKAFAHLRW